MTYITVEKINGLWNICLFEDEMCVADETVHFDSERDEIVDLYSEDGTIEVRYL